MWLDASKSLFTQKFSAVLVGLFALALICGLMFGPGGVIAPESLLSSWKTSFILKYRFNHLVLAMIAGSSLSVSGASLQALFRNQLADPHLFGISGGAALGASLCVAFFSGENYLPQSFGAMVGAFLSFLLIYSYVKRSQFSSLSDCLLVGVLINSVAAALITLLKTILPAHKTQSMLFWLVGNIGTQSSSEILWLLPFFIISMALLFLIRGPLEILSFGFEESQILGIDPKKITRIAIVANCILIGTVVSFAGMIGFIGLLVPHLVRLLFSADLKVVIPMSAAIGAIMMMIIDTISRLSFFIFQSEIPVGAISALIFSPLFFVLLLRNGGHE